MIWNSVPLMTIIDIVNVSLIVFLSITALRHRAMLSDLRISGALGLTIFGLAMIAAFHLADLASMTVLPPMIGREAAMATMMGLHLNWSWAADVMAIGAIVAGLSRMMRKLFPQLAGIIRSQKAEIEQRRAAERTLAANRAELQDAMDALPVLICYVDKDQHWRFNNKAYIDWLDHDPEELTGRHIRDGLGEATYEMIRPNVERALAGHGVTFEAMRPHASGNDRYARMTYVPRRGPEGNVNGFYAVATDVSEIRQAQEELAEAHARLEERVERRTAELQRANEALVDSEAKLAAIVENAPLPIVLKELDGRFSLLNKHASEVIGIDPEAAIGKTLFDIYPKEYADRYSAHEKDVVEENRAITREYADPTPMGLRDFILIKFPILGKNNIATGIGVVSLDIAERKKAENALQTLNDELEQRVFERTEALKSAQESLIQSERLATLGQLTATVSHELRNPLGVMRTSMYILRGKSEGRDDLEQRAIERTERGIDRCDRIIDDLLDFSRTRILDRERIVIDDWLTTLLSEQELPKHITLKLDLASPGVALSIDPERLRRAVINSYENACQAMIPEPARGRQAGDSRLLVATRATDERLEIRIQDNGVGMSEDVLEKLFVPLFSTKSFGTGLGLPTVENIMMQHDGGVEVESTAGRGATFVLWLPLRD